MKKILISIRPEWVAKILNGKKTLEIRKSAPKDLPCEVYIYVTKGEPFLRKYPFSLKEKLFQITDDNFNAINGKVVAKFTLNKTYLLTKEKSGYVAWCGMPCFDPTKEACLTQDDFDKYLKGKDGYAWYIDNLEIFDKPKELWEFDSPNGFIPCNKCLLFKSFLEGKCKGEHCNSLYKAPQSYCYVEVDG